MIEHGLGMIEFCQSAALQTSARGAVVPPSSRTMSGSMNDAKWLIRISLCGQNSCADYSGNTTSSSEKK
jgi:hypothetical protein